MVIGAQDVEQVLEAALALVEVVGDVGGEIGPRAVLPHDHPVLLVAEIGRAEPLGAVLLVDHVVLPQQVERMVDRAAVGQAAFGEPAVVANAEFRKVVADVGEDVREAEIEHARPAIGPQHLARAVDNRIDVHVLVARRRIRRQRPEYVGRGPQQRAPVLRQELVRDRQQVVAPVAIARELETLAAAFEIPQPDAGREDVHLAAEIVDVVLAVHHVPRRVEQVGDSRAVGGASPVADMERPGRVRRDELDEHALARRRPGCARRSGPRPRSAGARRNTPTATGRN